MKTNKPNKKNTEKNRAQYSIKSNVYNECCIRYKDIEYVIRIW